MSCILHHVDFNGSSWCRTFFFWFQAPLSKLSGAVPECRGWLRDAGSQVLRFAILITNPDNSFTILLDIWGHVTSHFPHTLPPQACLPACMLAPLMVHTMQAHSHFPGLIPTESMYSSTDSSTPGKRLWSTLTHLRMAANWPAASRQCMNSGFRSSTASFTCPHHTEKIRFSPVF